MEECWFYAETETEATDKWSRGKKEKNIDILNI